MKIFLVTYVELPQPHRLCLTLEQAKENLKEMISSHGEPYEGDDEWEGWDWWEDDGKHCFGTADQDTTLYRWYEGTVEEIHLEESCNLTVQQDFAFKLLDGDKQASDLFKDIVGA